MNLGRDSALLLLGCFVGVWITESFPKGESDQQKWERLEKAKEIRRANERIYETCVMTCMRSWK